MQAHRIQPLSFVPLVLALWLPLHATAGQISLTPMESRAVVGKEKMPVLTVTASSEDKTYVKTMVKEVLNANTPQQKEVDVSGSAESDLLVSPARFVLPPNGSKKLRLVYMEPVSKERDFRVYVTPVNDAAEQEKIAQALEGQRPAAGKAGVNGVSSKVGVSITWGALVRLLPENPQVAYQAEIRDGKFYLKNSGNVRFYVENLTHCDDSAICQNGGKTNGFNVYPDMEKNIGSAKSAEQLEFDLKDGDGGKPIHIVARELLSADSSKSTAK
jgi:hypothetical protein